MTQQVRLEEAAIDPAQELARFQAAIGGDVGAVVSFTGTCRHTTGSGERLIALVLESYKGATLASMEEIAASAHARFSITDLLVLHRAGRIAPGETIVFVATAAAHRRAAFEAADYVMDRLKSDAIFWKKEETSTGSNWIEPTDADYADKARWAAREDHAGN